MEEKNRSDRSQKIEATGQARFIDDLFLGYQEPMEVFDCQEATEPGDTPEIETSPQVSLIDHLVNPHTGNPQFGWTGPEITYGHNVARGETTVGVRMEALDITEEIEREKREQK